MEYKLKAWNFHASWNKTDFYDLFGPTRTSRRGYNIGLSYEREYTMQPPFKWHWGASVNAYGDMDALPMYQNVSVGNDVRTFQTANFSIGASKTRTSLGGITPEQGYDCRLSGYAWLVDGKCFPSLTLSLDEGV